jgi:hypothetical protein
VQKKGVCFAKMAWNMSVVASTKVVKHQSTLYRGSPTNAKFTNAVPTYAIFSLCTFKWVIFALVEFLEQSHLREFRIAQFFFKSQNLCNAGTLCTNCSVSELRGEGKNGDPLYSTRLSYKLVKLDYFLM